LRLRIVNPKALDPATIMPAYYRVAGLTAVGTAFAGKPILTAQEVEDVVAYLATLK
jgi:sulfur-oxidizing protein SoxX